MEPTTPDGYLQNFLDDVRRDRSRVLVVAGAGVSIATTKNDPVASWPGLLRHGVEYCTSHDLRDAEWRRRRLEALETGDLDELLGVAEQVERTLRQKREGVYAHWLGESIGSLKLVDTRVIDALQALGVTLATTNYDDLIEQHTKLSTVTWHEPGLLQQALRGDFKAVVHLHGWFRRPDTTVLGLRSYTEIVQDPRIQSLLRSAFRDRTLVFVGCGTGLDDPNFGTLRRWLSEVAADSPYHHYRLVTPTEKDSDPQLPGDLVVPVVYGPHEKLAEFLQKLATERQVAPLTVRQRPVLELTVAGDKVTAIARPGGEECSAPLNLDHVRATMVGMLEDRLRERDDSDSEQEKAEARLLGRILYEAVLTGEVRKLYERRRKELQADERLTLLLRVAPQATVPLLDDDGSLALAGLPWEVLYGSDGWLARHDQLALLRALPGLSARSVATEERLRVLVINAQPQDLLRAAEAAWPPEKWQAYTEAMKAIRGTLEGLRGHRAVQSLEHLDVPTPERLSRALMGFSEEDQQMSEDRRPNVVHYVGYAMQGSRSSGQIALLKDDGTVKWERYSDFADRCQALRLRLVFLHMCPGPSGAVEGDLRRANFALLARALLEKGVQLVVAMQYPLLPDVGARFTKEFYASVQNRNTTVGEAVQRARMLAAEFYRLGGPVLFLSQGDDAALVTGEEDRVGTSDGTPRGGQAAGRGGSQPAPAERSTPPPVAPQAVASPAAAPSPAVVTGPGQTGQRTFAGLRLLARSVARNLGIPMRDIEPMLASLWADCGGQSAPVDVEQIQLAIDRRYPEESDPRLQAFWEGLEQQLAPPDDAGASHG